MNELRKYVGNMDQLFSVKDYTLNGGKAQGVRAVDINNGSGLQLTVVPDRAMDIPYLSYKGINMSYVSNVGIVAPQYFVEQELGFHRGFFGGFLSTCGLRNAGATCEDEGEFHGLHGRIGNTPAQEVFAGVEDDTILVRGLMRESRFYGQNFVMRREISVRYGENIVYIEDEVENQGFVEEPFMILYHFNIGYPLLNENAYFVAPIKSSRPRDEVAAKGFDEFKKFQPPTEGYQEQVFYHELKADKRSKTFAAIVNPDLKLAAAVKYNKKELNHFGQWKMMSYGDYVCGLEPANCHVEGRAKVRADGLLQTLKPFEKRKFSLEIHVLEGDEEIAEGLKL